jgi:hypothetical protein
MFRLTSVPQFTFLFYLSYRGALFNIWNFCDCITGLVVGGLANISNTETNTRFVLIVLFDFHLDFCIVCAVFTVLYILHTMLASSISSFLVPSHLQDMVQLPRRILLLVLITAYNIISFFRQFYFL